VATAISRHDTHTVTGWFAGNIDDGDCYVGRTIALAPRPKGEYDNKHKEDRDAHSKRDGSHDEPVPLAPLRQKLLDARPHLSIVAAVTAFEPPVATGHPHQRSGIKREKSVHMGHTRG
jgi:hypothetical protein